MFAEILRSDGIFKEPGDKNNCQPQKDIQRKIEVSGHIEVEIAVVDVFLLHLCCKILPVEYCKPVYFALSSSKLPCKMINNKLHASKPNKSQNKHKKINSFSFVIGLLLRPKLFQFDATLESDILRIHEPLKYLC